MFQLAIHKIRLERRMTQEELALKSGLSQNYISLLEKGEHRSKSPTLKSLEQIAKALDVCPLTLIECCHCNVSGDECRKLIKKRE